MKQKDPTINLPQTDLPTRAGLATLEPALLATWAAHTDAPDATYWVHDGPPYPNGPIHAGHALNKILKDIVARSQTMMGHQTAFRPGWDCHGLPIETQVIKHQGAQLDDARFRDQCAAFAHTHVTQQCADFQRLGIRAAWDTPYLTSDPHYESHVIHVFKHLVETGLLYHGRKPIHWCTQCQTALAEAEIEYNTHKSTALITRFKLVNAKLPDDSVIATTKNKPVFLWVWTTTPWTLPANVGLAVNPDIIYDCLESDTDISIVARHCWPKLAKHYNLPPQHVIGSVTGADLVNAQVKHPFLDKIVPVGDAGFVTETDGTGIVHIAPGHGQDDYHMGQRLGWETLMPVGGNGCYTGDFLPGVSVFEATDAIIQVLNESGTRVAHATHTHAYPHCWRCHKPVIFRATPQWFIALDQPIADHPEKQTLRQAALAAIETIKWVPAAGYNRMKTMLENRPDWCISRQRRWGIPLPIMQCQTCQQVNLEPDTIAKIQDYIGQHGSTHWVQGGYKELTLPCKTCGHSDLVPSSDILDVWFESGSSFMIHQQPASVVIEGSDQHRGWFQASILLSVATRQSIPFETVVTHGFIVDDAGKKMSKSGGNALQPEAIIRTYGADILRWWVATVNAHQDVSLSTAMLDQAKNGFLKIRNTMRFLLGILSDIPAATVNSTASQVNPTFFDRWIIGQAQLAHDSVKQLYAQFDTHRAMQVIYNFCAVTLSQYYCDGRKDRFYCDAADSADRRSAQYAIYCVTNLLIRMIAPVLVFTADAIYAHMPHRDTALSTVHELLFLADGCYDTDQMRVERDTLWPAILTIRETVHKQAEQLRADKQIKQFLELHVTITVPDSLTALCHNTDWEAILVVSSVTCTVSSDVTHPECTVQKSSDNKCVRCWKYKPLVTDHCHRCHAVVTA